MRAGFVFLKLQWKKYSKILPVILAESLLFAAVMVFFGVIALKILKENVSIAEIKVAVVSEEDEELTDLLVRFVGGMESFKERVSFLQMGKKQALKALEEGEVLAAIVLPEGVLEGILDGENIPARIILSRAGSEMETAVFEEVVQAGARMLAAAQAGIYAADDFCLKTGHPDKVEETEDYLNRVYLEYSLNRNAVFRQEQISATGKVGLLPYYGAALLLVFFTFAGIVMGKYVQVFPTEPACVLAASGLRLSCQYLCDASAFAGVFALSGGVMGCPVLLACIRREDMGSKGVLMCMMFIVVLFAIGVFIRVLLQITGNESGGIGCLFLILFAIMFACGLFLPSAFLPLWADHLSRILPYKFWLDVLLEAMWDEVTISRVVLLLSGCTISLLAGAVLFSLKGRKIGRRHAGNDR